ncbi:MAG: sugar diacid recognition domain-containing protein [Eubacteriales bacterium]|nr:sugar diacid recognition domain-containing protein [Eubacteriales bacterium]
MRISKQSAQLIVNEIGEVVRQNINMMDEHGYIIASTDDKRIGNFHEAARKIIDEHLSELYISPADVTPTVRAGLNLSISYEGQIFGVIGITGEYEQVKGYGQVVKKMTEILIRESIDQDEIKLKQRILSRFLEDWILGNGLLQHQGLAERGQTLNIDITLPRRVMVISVQNLEKHIDTALGQKMIDEVESTVSHNIEAEYGNLILRNAARQIVLLRRRTDVQMEHLAIKLSTLIFDRYGVRLSVGIDGEASDLHQSYIQANQAWRSARSAKEGIRAYDQVTLEMFTGEVSRQTKVEYIRKIFRNCDYREISRWIQILEVYFSVEGSINAAASALFIHKNTLQFKLKKLKEISGLDVRMPSNLTAFYIAMLFFEDIEGYLKI